MKLSKIQAICAAVVVASLAVFFSAFNASEVRTTEAPDGITTAYGAAGKEDVITKTFTHDTLTTTEIDTLNLGYSLQSPYQYSYQMNIAKVSGTPSLKVVLDTRNSFSNSDWMGIDSVSASGADSTKTYFLLTGDNTFGLQHRLRLVGTTGVNQYDITALLKKTK